MAYSKVFLRKSGKALLKYAIGKDAKGHNGNERRNEVIGYVNLVPGVDVTTQMQQYWDKMKSGHKNQMIHVIQSFSKNEFNPDDPNDLQMANQLGVEFAQLHYPGRQVAVFTLIDGKEGYVHNHIAVNNVSMEDYRACDKEQYYHPMVKKWTDEITEKYTVRDVGRKTQEKMTITELDRVERGAYSWKMDLRDRIKKSLKEFESVEEQEQEIPEEETVPEKDDTQEEPVTEQMVTEPAEQVVEAVQPDAEEIRRMNEENERRLEQIRQDKIRAESKLPGRIFGNKKANSVRRRPLPQGGSYVPKSDGYDREK